MTFWRIWEVLHDTGRMPTLTEWVCILLGLSIGAMGAWGARAIGYSMEAIPVLLGLALVGGIPYFVNVCDRVHRIKHPR